MNSWVFDTGQRKNLEMDLVAKLNSYRHNQN